MGLRIRGSASAPPRGTGPSRGRRSVSSSPPRRSSRCCRMTRAAPRRRRVRRARTRVRHESTHARLPEESGGTCGVAVPFGHTNHADGIGVEGGAAFGSGGGAFGGLSRPRVASPPGCGGLRVLNSRKHGMASESGREEVVVELRRRATRPCGQDRCPPCAAKKNERE